MGRKSEPAAAVVQPCGPSDACISIRTIRTMVDRHIRKTYLRRIDTPISVMKQNMEPNLIRSDPAVLMGKPVVAGTRITVELILEKLAAGETIEQLLAAHPRLTAKGIHAALKFAADVLRADVVYPAAGQGG